MSIQNERAGLLAIPPERSRVSLAALRTRFARDEQGAVAMIYGLAFIPCLLMVGFAVDYGRIVSVKQNTQSVLDGAALAAARAWQSASENKDAEALAAAQAYWAAVNPNTETPPPGETVAQANARSFRGAAKHAINGLTKLSSPVITGDTLKMEVEQFVKTPFFSPGELIMSSASISNPGGPNPSSYGCDTTLRCMQVKQKTEVKLMTSGNDDGNTLEIAVMLDVTGSMKWKPGTTSNRSDTDPEQKLYMMKEAAKSFVDIVLPRQDTSNSIRMALVPFSQTVYVGNTVVNAVSAPSNTGCTRNVAGCSSFTFSYRYWDDNRWKWADRTDSRHAQCLGLRTGTQAYTDASPATQKFPPVYRDGDCLPYDDAAPASNKLIPLINNPAPLKTAINALKANGGTAGQIGTAWAWYTLSPNWSGIWTGDSTPRAYNADKNKKVAVLMTDGDYNHEHCKGVSEYDISESEANRTTVCTPTPSQQQAEAVCANMKAAGITLYTIAFDVSVNARTFLREKCSTSPQHAYTADNQASLTTAFQDIALKTARVVVFK